MSVSYPTDRIAVDAGVLIQYAGDFRQSIFLANQYGPAWFTQCTWRSSGTRQAGNALTYLPVTPSAVLVALVLNQDPTTYVQLVDATGTQTFVLPPNGGVYCFMTTVGVTAPDGASNWSLLAVNADGSPSGNTANVAFLLAG